jgi:hypothetical protein
MNTLLEQARASPYLDFSTAEYRLNSMIMDVAHHKLFKPSQITDTPPESFRQYFKLTFSIKRTDTVKLSNTPRHERTKITNSNQSHKSYGKYKSENGRTWTSEYIRGGIRCQGGVSIPCWPVIPALSPIFILDKLNEPQSISVCQEKVQSCIPEYF